MIKLTDHFKALQEVSPSHARAVLAFLRMQEEGYRAAIAQWQIISQVAGALALVGWVLFITLYFTR